MSKRFSPVLDLGPSALVGMRTMSPLALLSYEATRQPGGFEGTPFSVLDSRRVFAALVLAALGEVLFDKTPFAPDRISLMPLAGRVGWGAAVGAAVFARRRRSLLAGGIAGGFTAAVSAYASYHLRRVADQRLGWPDLLAGLVEDGLVLTVGPWMLH